MSYPGFPFFANRNEVYFGRGGGYRGDGVLKFAFHGLHPPFLLGFLL